MGKNDLLDKEYFDLKGLWCQHEGFGLGDTLKGCWTIKVKCFNMD